ncbi:hypothetical protein PBRA_009538 [Plasmodiophora brassicae]|uniref:Uncharacterized protein n=1 Tax=Plasmodiophora brassicae TaxID=37360 RepID=A0A0G4J8J9_PLABS|nr:hypothetical protein PBRA_009538 [Plasmodiophora brassicae]
MAHEYPLPYMRLVVQIPYEDADRFDWIVSRMTMCNASALQVPAAAVNSIRFQGNADVRLDPSNDIVTGIQLTDGRVRVIVLEGIRQSATMQQIASRFQRAESWPIVLSNDLVSFSTRLYAAFNASLKSIRLRTSFASLQSRTPLYVRRHNDDPSAMSATHRAISKVLDLCACRRLERAKYGGMFPTVDEVAAVEKTLGGPITEQDAFGRPRPAPVQPPTWTALSTCITDADRNRSIQDVCERAAQCLAKRGPATTTMDTTGKVPGDAACTAASTTMTRRRQQRLAQPLPPWGTIYRYSGQARSYVQWYLGELRRQADPDAMYVRNADQFVFLGAIPDMTPAERQRTELERSRRRWMTPSGFSLHTHARQDLVRPSPARCQELMEPWVDPHRRQADDVGNGDAGQHPSSSTSARPPFDTVPRHSSEFGYPGNPLWHKSVHDTSAL